MQFSSEYFELIFDTSVTMILITDGHKSLHMNKKILNFLGYENLEVFYQEHSCVCDFFLQRDGYLQKEMGSLTWLEYVLQYQDTIHKIAMQKEKSIYFFQIQARELDFKENNYVVIEFIDITEQENIEKRYELAVAGSKDGLWDWDLQSDTLYFSPRWKEMLGYRDDEIINDFKSWEYLVHKDDINTALKKIAECHSNPDIEYKIIYRMQHKDGHWVWILDRGQTLFDSDGNPTRMLGFHTDLTESMTLERKLKESKKMFDLFMNNIPYIVVIKDENLVVQYENPVGKLYHKDTAVGHIAEENLGRELALKVDALSRKAQKDSKAEAVLEYVYNDTTYIFRVLAFAIPQEDEKVYVGMIYIDITKEKHMSDELQETKELMIAQSRHAAMGEMISMIAHQWRQPISVISMDANNILVDVELDTLDKNSLVEDANDIVNQTQHLSKTIDDFRNFFKPNKHKDVVVVSDVFHEALKVIDKSFANNNVSFENEFYTDTKIEIYSRELLQVFLNILKNAKEELVQRRENSRKIVNKIYENRESVIVEISDNAGGVDKSIIDKIFDPYFSTKEEKNGTGLGLYMSKVILEKHLHGTIGVRNTQEGAVFTITLPKNMEMKNG